MAGSTFKPPRPSGSVKRLMGVAQNQGVPASTPQNTRLQGPPGFQQPAPKTRAQNDVGAIRSAQDTVDTRRKYNSTNRLVPSITQDGYAKPIAANPAPAERPKYTQAAPAPEPVNTKHVGSGMVTTQGQQHTQDSRMGVNVGNQITVDNNQASPGAASQEYATEVRNYDPNSIYYDAERTRQHDLTKPSITTAAQQQFNQSGLDQNGISSPAQFNKQGLLPGREGVVKLPMGQQTAERLKTDAAAYRKEQDVASRTGPTYQLGSVTYSVAPDGRVIDITDPNNPKPISEDGGRAETYRSRARDGIAQQVGQYAHEGIATQGRGLSAAQGGNTQFTNVGTKKSALSLGDILDPVGAIAGAVTGDNTVRDMHTGIALGGPVGGVAASKMSDHSIDDSDRTDAPSEITRRYPGLTEDEANDLVKLGYEFSADGERVVTPSGVEYTGSEISDFLKGDMRGYDNATEGVGDLMKIRSDREKNKGEADLANKRALEAQALQQLKDEIAKPIDISEVSAGYDKALHDTRQAGARNKALALKAMQERGAYSGASVNQMMGQQTEAGYAYDTQNQAQESMISLQKAQAEVQAAMMQNQRKIDLANLIYAKASTTADQQAAWMQMQQAQAAQNQYNAQMQAIQAEMNSPSLGMTLAKVGVGAAGAILAPYTGGASLLASGAILGGMGAMGGGGGAPGYIPQYQYKAAPGSSGLTQSDFIYQTGYAPGSSNSNPLSPGQLRAPSLGI